MAENLSGSPVFAGHYRFQPVGNDWDRGRSGFTALIHDEIEGRRGVIKRAETNSKRNTEELRNEVKALNSLKGLGVPEVYEISHAVYDSKNYDYMVIEYIEGVRVEKSLVKLSNVERAEIITQFFGLLSQAHQKGIINGDIDLKHLFWRDYNGKKQLIVIDWGNARLGADPKNKTEFAYDLARSAEIIFALVTDKGEPPATGSLALPDSSGIRAGLGPLPKEFRALCKWAPRTPAEGTPAPYTARELFEISKKWLAGVQNPSGKRRIRVLGISMVAIVAIIALLLAAPAFSSLFPVSGTVSPTPAIIVSETPSVVTSVVTTDSPVATEATSPTTTSTEAVTLTPSVTILPNTYSPILTFDRTLNLNNQCWQNETILDSVLQPILNEGFYRRTDRNWAFNVDLKHSVDDVVQVDFGPCRENQEINAFALNAWVIRLDQHALEPSREFGVFLENQAGQRREYTLWLSAKNIFLRIRENNSEPKDYPIDIINPANIKLDVGHPRTKSNFRIMLFLDLNNQGSDIIYMLEGPLDESVKVEDMVPGGMFRIGDAMLPTLGDIKKVGLIGRGGKTETLIWPLVLLERKTK